MAISLSQSAFEAAAAMSRRVPRFRGKGRLAAALARVVHARQSTVVRMRDGSLMRLDSRSELESTAIWTGDYDLDLIERLARLLGPDDVALDVGASVGFWTIPLARKLATIGGRVYAFEPRSSNFDRLLENVAMNGLADAVHCHRTALGDEEGCIDLAGDYRNGAVTGNAVIMRGRACSYLKPTDTSPVTRLDRLAGELQIDRCRLMKLDIEGAEVMALHGAQEFVRRCRPIIYGEFSRFWMEHFGHSFVHVVDQFRPLGYSMFCVGREGVTAVTEPANGPQEVLLVPHESVAVVLNTMALRRIKPVARAALLGLHFGTDWVTAYTAAFA